MGKVNEVMRPKQNLYVKKWSIKALGGLPAVQMQMHQFAVLRTFAL